MRKILPFLVLMLWVLPIRAQEGLNLPAVLYVLLNSGTVERYGIGAAGVQAVTPEDDFVLDFAIAPDGARMAYRTESGLVLYDLVRATAEPVLLEGATADIPPVRGRGETLAWSPGGDALAYTTSTGIRTAFDVDGQPVFANISVSPIYDLKWSPDGTFLAAEAEQNVWWIYRRFENQMILTSAIPFSRGAAWLDDSRLVFAPEAGLIVMDMADRNTQTTLLDLTRVYLLPYVQAAEGALVVFSRPAGAAELDDMAGAYQRFAVQGGALSLVESSDNLLNLSGVRWSPGGELLTLFTGGSLVLVLPQSGEGFTLPIVNAVTYGWGSPRPDAVTGFSAGGDGYFIAPSNEVQQVWRLPGNGLPPIMLTAAAANVTDYSVSDVNLAYVSDNRIWIQPLGGSQAVELTATAEQPLDLAFNPAGDTLAYATVSTENTPDGGIWTVPVAGGESTLLLRNEPGGGDLPMLAYSKPRFAPNFNALLVERRTGERIEQVVLDLSSGEVIELGAYLESWWLTDGRVLLYSRESGSNTVDARLAWADITTLPIITTPLLRAPDTRVEAVTQVSPGEIRVLLRQGDDPAFTLVAVQLEGTAGGEPDEITRIDYFAEPDIAPDGVWVAGLLEPEGELTLHNIPQGETIILASPEGVSTFGWHTFRER